MELTHPKEEKFIKIHEGNNTKYIDHNIAINKIWNPIKDYSHPFNGKAKLGQIISWLVCFSKNMTPIEYSTSKSAVLNHIH